MKCLDAWKMVLLKGKRRRNNCNSEGRRKWMWCRKKSKRYYKKYLTHCLISVEYGK